jgi:GH35 family endo-1,4-beta-xylanase
MKRFTFSSIIVLFAFWFVNSELVAQGGNTLPSCVITYPHSNAYYQEGTDMLLRVYSTDIGGTFANGSVTKVEFFVDDLMVHETTAHVNNTYSFLWENLVAGNYRITARATDNLGATFTSAGVLVFVGQDPVIRRGLSAGKGKYLGNIISNNDIRRDFNSLWNAVTAENGAKWGVVEGTKDVMNWTQADKAYYYALHYNMAYRYHAIAWGSQFPNWITTLSPVEFQTQLEEYMVEVAARYPYMDQIDVLNEQLRTHAPGTGYFRDALGGTGTTGYDWQIWIFEKARQHFPNSKLVLNDYGLENDQSAINEMLGLVKVLRDRGLIDGFGTQSHHFNVDQMAAIPTTLKNRIDLMASGGVPVYATELDLRGTASDEASQLTSYSKTFPVFWEHPAVAGITLWGYVEGQTWRTGTGILNSDGSKRSAMIWLEDYLSNQPNVGFPFDGIEPEPDTNMLLNGEFNMGTTGWSIQNNSGASGTMSTVSDAAMSEPYALKICPIIQGTANWHIQVRHSAPIENGKQYEISFLAKADEQRPLSVALQQNTGGYTTYFQQNQTLTQQAQLFTYSYNANVTDATTLLKFYVGNSPECVYIDDVKLIDLSSTTSLNDKNVGNSELNFNIYPNPFSGQLVIASFSGIERTHYTIFNVNGQSVMKGSFDNSTNISTDELPLGLYIIQLETGHITEMRKIIKR